MKLEFGKKYRCRDIGIKWARVDAIRPESSLTNNQVAITVMYKDGEIHALNCDIDGIFSKIKDRHAYDLMAPYEEPHFAPTEKDIGRVAIDPQEYHLMLIAVQMEKEIFWFPNKWHSYEELKYWRWRDE